LLFSKPPIPSQPNQPDWWIAIGDRSSRSQSKLLWQDELISIRSHGDPATVPINISDRLVTIGDLWLSDRSTLLSRLDLSPQNWQGDDVELITRLWDRFGEGILSQISGMFAIVIYEIKSQKLLLIRDPVGMKTLYYNDLAIAPRLSTLAPYRSNQLDPIALRDYLCCSFVPGDRTLWQDVRELRPGTMLSLLPWESTSYWQLPQQSVLPDRDLDWHGDNLRTLLTQVVTEYLPRDRPVGVFLSGGLDSSCITALVKQLHAAPVHTYSIHFGVECPNELAFSSLVAAHCHTEHHILEITFEQMWSELKSTMALLDDPIGDPLTVPNLLLGKLARSTVDTIFNGEGGDPCFGGPKNQPMLIDSLYGNHFDRDPSLSFLTSFQKCAADLPTLLEPDLWQQVKDVPSIYTADLINNDLNYLNRLMGINVKYKGADQILTKVNNLTQAVGLSARSPLFDRRIVELSMQIPPEYKLAGNIEKAVLKQAVRDLLPSAVIDRPKSGMMVPVQLGFKQYWQRSARKLLLNKHAQIAPYLDRAVLRSWLDYRGDTWNRYGVKLWLIVSLELWLQAQNEISISKS
jgi:asparagine synthase (glutamine-hydrolysing)